MSNESAPYDSDELARCIAITRKRNWSQLGVHDPTSVAEYIGELAERESIRLQGEVERLSRERDAAIRRSEADGRVVVKMGTRNREMMSERDAAIERAESAERELGEALRFASAMHRREGWGDDDAEACWMLFGITVAERLYGKEALAWVHEEGLGPGGTNRDLYAETQEVEQ